MKFTDKKIGLSTFVFLLLCAIIISALSTYFILDSKLESASKSISEKELLVSKLLKADELITKRFAGTLPATSSLVDGLLNGYLNSLPDRFALYLTKENYRAYNSVADGVVNMLGIISSYNGDIQGIVIDSVMEGSPAAKKDLRRGDILVKIGGVTVTKNNYFVLLHSLMGKDGSEADLQINRNGELLTLTVKLSSTAYQPVASYFFDELGVGVIHIGFFGEKAAVDFESYLNGVTEKGAAGLILDLRGCAGGNIQAATKVLDRLLPAGIMLTETSIDSKLKDAVSSGDSETTYQSDETALNTPMVVLTDEYTKGVAELFAAVMKSNNFAVVGAKTFGKTALPDIINLGDETAIMFSSHTYKNTKGEVITGAVEPTEPVALSDELKIKLPNLDSNEDTQLKQALTHFSATKEVSQGQK